MVALHEDLPSEVRLVADMKRQGTFDELRKLYLTILEENVMFKRLRADHDIDVDNFLATQQWKPTLKKEELRKELRKHMQKTSLMRTRFPQLISDVIKENDREHIVPSVEKYARIAMSQREQKQKEQTPVKDDQKDAEIHVKLEIKSEPKAEEIQAQIKPEPTAVTKSSSSYNLDNSIDEETHSVDLDSMTLEERIRYMMDKGLDQNEPDHKSLENSPIPEETEDQPTQPAGALANFLQLLTKKPDVLRPLTKQDDASDFANAPSPGISESGSDGGATPTMDEPGTNDDTVMRGSKVPIISRVVPATDKNKDSSSSDSSSSSEDDSDSSSSDSDDHHQPKIMHSKVMREKLEARRRASNADLTRSSDRKKRRSSDRSSPSPPSRPTRGTPTYETYRQSPDEGSSRNGKSSRSDDRRRKDDKEKSRKYESSSRRRSRDSSPDSSSDDDRRESTSKRPYREERSESRRSERDYRRAEYESGSRDRSERSYTSERPSFGRNYSDNYTRHRAPSVDRRGMNSPWNQTRPHFVPYHHHQSMSIRHHRPSFDITRELAEESHSLSSTREEKPREKVRKPVEQSPEDGELEDGEVSD